MIDVEVFVGDSSVPLDYLVVDQDGVAIDLSTATVKRYTLIRPDGTTQDVTATFVNSGTDGRLRYVVSTIDQDGIWRYRAWYTNALGTYYADWLEFLAKESSPTIVSSWGASISNSYVTLLEANSFIYTGLIYTVPWDDATDRQKEAALITATADIDAQQYVGSRYYYTQKLEWPRATTRRWPYILTTGPADLNTVEQARMMDAVKRACCHQAVFRLQFNRQENEHLQRIAIGIEAYSESNPGPLSESVKYGRKAGQMLSPEMMKLLAPWTESRRVFRK